MRENPPITTMFGLLEALFVDAFGGRKTGACVKSYRAGEAEVREYFDDGKGHSGAFSSTTAPLDWSVFEEARQKRFVSGALEPGYVSTTEFKLTDQGTAEFLRLRNEADAATQSEASAG